MTACPPQTFAAVTRPVWQNICATLAKQHPELGAGPVPDQGTASDQGYAIAWSFVEATWTLTVQCTDSPWWAPCSAIGEAIAEMVDDAIATIGDSP